MFTILQSYFEERQLRVDLRHDNVTTRLFPIRSGVPQRSFHSPILYLIYTARLPTSNNVITATHAGDTAVSYTHLDVYKRQFL